MAEQETRDIAIEARTLAKSHIDDCIQFRQQLAKTSEITNNKLDDLGDKITKLQIRASMALGGLFVAGKGIEILIGWLHAN